MMYVLPYQVWLQKIQWFRRHNPDNQLNLEILMWPWPCNHIFSLGSWAHRCQVKISDCYVQGHCHRNQSKFQSFVRISSEPFATKLCMVICHHIHNQTFSLDILAYDHPEVTMCGWQDIKIQLLPNFGLWWSPIKPGSSWIAKEILVQKIQSYFDYLNPHCDIDVEGRSPIILHYITPYSDAPPNQIWLQKAEQF